jgi:hypothetical protein
LAVVCHRRTHVLQHLNHAKLTHFVVDDLPSRPSTRNAILMGLQVKVFRRLLLDENTRELVTHGEACCTVNVAL